MFEIILRNKKTGKTFSKWFYDKWAKNDFVRKCKYGNKLEVLQELDYSHLYD